MNIHRVISIGIGIILLIGNWYASGEEAQNIIGQHTHVEAIVQTVEKLQELKVEAYDANIPIPVQPLIIQLRHQVCDLILETMNGRQWNTPQDIQQHVVSTLYNNGIPIQEYPYEDEQEYYTYDKITHIQIEHPPQHPDLIVAMMTSWVMCGRDTAFYLFQKTEQEWRLIAVQETTDYGDIGDAQQAFHYAISPSDTNGQFFIVTASTNPWCSSFWKGLRYYVFRVSKNPYQPMFLFQGEEFIYKWYYTITIHPTKFWIEFAGSAGEYQKHWYLNSTISTHIVSYDVDGERVTGNHFVPEDYVGKWSDLPWEEASTWVHPPLRTLIAPWHTRLREIGEAYYSFSVLTSNEQNPDRLQIGVQLHEKEVDASTVLEELCFILNRQDEWYMIQEFYPSQCSHTFSVKP